LCLEKLFVQLTLYQPQSTKALLPHPFGAWLLLFSLALLPLLTRE